jgi:hypothetical protein
MSGHSGQPPADGAANGAPVASTGAPGDLVELALGLRDALVDDDLCGARQAHAALGPELEQADAKERVIDLAERRRGRRARRRR